MQHFMTTLSLGLFLFVTARAEEIRSAETVIQNATAKASAYKTWTADYVQTMSMLGSEMNIRGQIAHKAPQRMRLEMDLPMMGQSAKMKVVTGADGIMWQEMNMAGQLRVMKTDTRQLADDAGKMGLNSDPLQGMDPAKQWEQSRLLMDLTLLPPAELHGQAMHVIRGDWKPAVLTNQQTAAAARMFGTTRMYLGQEDGFLHKTEMWDAAGSNVVMSMEFRNLQFNTDIPDSAFQYEPPAGVPVVDLTTVAGQMQPGAPAPATR